MILLTLLHFQVIMECQTDPAYQASLIWLMSRMETYFSEVKIELVEGVQRSKLFFKNPRAAKAAAEFRIILERWANNESMADILEAVQKLVLLSLQDEKLRKWWAKIHTFIKKVLCVGPYPYVQF